LKTLLLVAVALAVGGALGYSLAGSSKGGDPTRRGPRREIDKHAHPISLIRFRVEKGQPPMIAEKLAIQAYEAVRSGRPFEEIARARSQDSSAVDGGFVGFVQAWGDSAFAGAIQTLEPGTYTPPLRDKDGFQILMRHTFEEGRKLEQRYRIPTHGVFVRWAGLPGAEPYMTREKALEEATRLRAALGAGKMTLDEAAKLHVAEKDRRPDAWIGMIPKRPKSQKLYDALADAKPGAIVGPLETENGYAVLVRGHYLRSLVRHIIVKHVQSKDRDIRISRLPQEAAQLAQKALDEALADPSKWDQVVEKYTDDAQSRLVGGLIGVIDPGGLPQGFGAVIYDIPPGEIYDKVVETPQGFHVIWRVN
jgi:parvulin-like peptidyl-prolyl isomerase